MSNRDFMVSILATPLVTIGYVFAFVRITISAGMQACERDLLNTVFKEKGDAE